LASFFEGKFGRLHNDGRHEGISADDRGIVTLSVNNHSTADRVPAAVATARYAAQTADVVADPPTIIHGRHITAKINAINGVIRQARRRRVLFSAASCLPARSTGGPGSAGRLSAPGVSGYCDADALSRRLFRGA